MRPKNNLKHFRVVVINPLNSGSICLFCESVLVSTILEKRIFVKFSGRIVHETKNNLKHFRVVVINPLNSGSIFLFCESVVVSSIMEKRMNGFS